jgi:hypothetical protein
MQATPNPGYPEFSALLVEWYGTTLSSSERIKLARVLVKLIDRHGAANLVANTQLTATMLNTLRQFAVAHGYGRANPDYVEFKALLIEWYDTTLTTDERIRLARSLVKLIERYGASNLVSHTQLTPTMINTLRSFAQSHGYGDLALENEGDGDCGCDDEDENMRGPKSPMSVFTMGLIGGALAAAALGRFDRFQG